jgi:beta-lactamase regulating signal transducer with metallopeptidase domain
MTISVFSVIMSIACSSVILFAASFLVAHAKRVRWGLLLMIFVLGFVRLAIPLEFREAKEVFVWKFYPTIQMFANRKVFLGITVAGMLGIIWLAGILILLVNFLRKIYALKQIIQRSVPFEEVDFLCEIYDEAVRSLDYQGNVRIAVTADTSIPVSVGCFHPIVLIPKEVLEYPEIEIYGIIRHELMHFLRGDIGKKRAVDILQCIFWWNPVVYYLRRSVVEMLEMECDDRTCKGMSEDEKLIYFEAVQRALTAKPNKKILDLGMSYTSIHKGKYLRRRYLEVLQPIPKQSGAVTGILAVISIALFCFSYTFVLQPAILPNAVKTCEVEMGDETDKGYESNSFLLRISENSYMYVSDMLSKGILTKDEIQNPPYNGLPIYDIELREETEDDET